ncbi:uncharacterized protein LOC110107408 [Dendrobium catenatum]|uniref:uncharacterized protein LOC110107408 n=1 Tax=Dendrobium catenatum TaxID=906689 RepID=UPI0009F299D2|nr:uncharacterized protein LOC110107408 [Dendrobium catenatum]
MPKDRRSRSVSFDRASPFPSRSSNCRRHSPLPSSSRNPPRSPLPVASDFQKWDEIRCPVCMEHPHNAVLLLCASHDKGCRPFMCDTSYRHSNCLDQYRKAIQVSMPGDSKPKLSCPLCRGVVSGSKVVEAARKHMNTKARSCSSESCGFAGAYSELRKHARTEHPLVRPSEADPERERDWRRLEQQRDLGDLFSTMQSAFGGEEDDYAFLADGGEFGGLLPFPTITFFLVLRFRGTGGLSSSTGWSNGRRGSSRSSRSRRGMGRVLWGESIVESEAGGRDRSDADDGDDANYDYDHDNDDENDENDGDDDDGGGEDVPSPSRRRQRRTRRQLTMVDDDDENIIM